MQSIIRRHREFWRKELIPSLFFSILILGLSFLFNYWSFQFADFRQSNYVSDLILDFLPVVDLGAIFVWGFLLIAAATIILSACHPSKILFLTKTLALFIFIRSLFVILTNIKVHPESVKIDSSLLSLFSSEGDLFFSAHTGIPFLMALIFWREKAIRLFYLLSSFVLALIVLFTHVHYSIDVFSAYFITFGIYALATQLFRRDFQLDPEFLPIFSRTYSGRALPPS